MYFFFNAFFIVFLIFFFWLIYSSWFDIRNSLSLIKQFIKRLYFKFANITIFLFISLFIKSWKSVKELYTINNAMFMKLCLKIRIMN